jgi:hypothetical protein
MNSKTASPKWWQLYLALPLLVGLFMVDFRLNVSTREHQVVQLGILLFVYWLVHLWLKANQVALGRADHAQQPVIITFVQTPLPSERNARPSLQLPDSEVKGLLDSTFEMDIIDAEFFPTEKVSQELNKE